MDATLTLRPAPAATIDEVIARLDAIIARSAAEGSRMGYFAALYRRVTVAVKDGIAAGRFEDGPRMERLDVAFADRYLAAEEAWRRGEPLSRSWRVAFEAARTRPPIVLQHLFLGMNAHINLDLGVAAAEVAPGALLPGLKRDFDEINVVLAGLLDEVKSEVDEVSPWIGMLDRLHLRDEDRFIDWSMGVARAEAWDFAVELAPLDASARAAAIRTRDAEVALLARLVRAPPGVLPKLLVMLVRSRETMPVPDVIRVLDRPTRRVPVSDASKAAAEAAARRAQ